MPYSPQIKIIGKIDLEEFLKQRSASFDEGHFFKIISLRFRFMDYPSITMDFGKPLDTTGSVGGYFTLLLGKNATGKSSLLRELIEFFIDAQQRKVHARKSIVTIEAVKYNIDGVSYGVECQKKIYGYFKNNRHAAFKSMKFPLVIASTMGMFDKFPVNKQADSDKGRYKQQFYRYVGPKASSNMFTSKLNVLFQLLTALPSVKNPKQLQILADIIRFIGYEPKIVLKYEIAEKKDRADYKNKLLIPNYRLFDQSDDIYLQELTILPEDSRFDEIKALPMHELKQYRQKGLLKSLKCCFYRNGKEFDADSLSSGEFNLLSIVMSVILLADNQHLLFLLDEPEISQHPNWQLDLISNLEKALVDFGCHFIIATHCHFLVSNLPINRSNVFCIKRNDDDSVNIINMPSETYGWSSEQVLLEAFGVPTDRSRYLAKMVSDFLKEIGECSVSKNEVSNKVSYFKEISCHLNSYDPMKRILDTIINEFA